MRVTGVENTPDAMDVKAFCSASHTPVTLSWGCRYWVYRRSLRGNIAAKKATGRPAAGEYKRASSQQFTSSIEKIYRNLPISLGDSASVVGS
jgi:hypothetical protein